MTKENLRDAIGKISEKTVECFLQSDDMLKAQRKKLNKSKHSTYLRILAACLCILVMGSSVFLIRGAYSRNDPSDETTSENITDPFTSGPTENYKLFDTEAFKEKYGGQSVNILCWDSPNPEFEITQEDMQSGNILKAAVYQRNLSASEALGLTLEFNEQDDDSYQAASMLKYIETQIANEESFDIMALYTTTAALLLQKGHLLPLNHIDEYLNLENPWYPKNIVNDTQIKGNIYYVSGDISTNMIYSAYGFVFNKTLLKENPDIGYSADDLYTLVREQNWTVEEMYKLVTNYWTDLDGDEKKSKADGFGFRSYNYHLDALCFGAGFEICEINNDAEEATMLLTLSPDYTGQKAIDFVDYIGKLMTSNSAINDEFCAKNFSLGNDILLLNCIKEIEKLASIEDHDIDYGLLPVPKYDSLQSDYRSYISRNFTLWGISSTQTDNYPRQEMSAAVIETMGYYAMEYTTPEIFNSLFPYQHIHNNTADEDNFILTKNNIRISASQIFVIKDSFYLGSETIGYYAAKGQDYSKYVSTFRGYYRQSVASVSKNLFEISKKFNPS